VINSCEVDVSYNQPI